MISGVPDHVDGLMQGVVNASGGSIINADRMWHYPEGIHNWAPIWPLHGIRILSGPSPLWLDARGRRLPVPLFPGFDSLGALAQITREGHDHSWFLLNERIIAREFAL
jgi:predicted oxidoreductase